MSSMDVSQASLYANNGKKTDKTRRVWSKNEEDELIKALKTLAVLGLKSENGFKPGYLSVLEKELHKSMPGTDIRGNPHIHSKIHVWKKQHLSLFTMLSRSGFGFNETLRTIDTTNEVWEEYARTDPNAKGMRSKSWPYYYDWCEIFGKDRATGEFVEVFGQVAKEIETEEMQSKEQGTPPIPTEKGSMADATEDCLSEGTGSFVTKGTKKRKKGEITQLSALVDAVNIFTEKADRRMGEISNRIGFEFDMSQKRNRLFKALGEIPGIPIRDRIKVATHLVKSKEELELFFSMEGMERVEYAHMLNEKYRNLDL